LAKPKAVYICSECGHQVSRWLGKCPACEQFNTMQETWRIETPNTQRGLSDAGARLLTGLGTPATLKEIQTMTDDRTTTGMAELDRVLSGGIVPGSLILVGGDPGIGKSTLLLQICQHLGDRGKKTLYISGEESARQLKLRAERLDVSTDNLLVLSETNLGTIELVVRDVSPDLVIVDSIQTIYKEELPSSPGSVAQVRECTSALLRLCKSLHVPVFIVGHVTKEGAIAGPRVLEHMVDTVLYFEGERSNAYRIIRAVKNRFGSTNEIGVFEMGSQGLMEIANPSAYMLSGRPIGVSGSAVTCCVEGTRPILTEVQALISYTNFGMPRRMATGMDYNRVVMLMAVLEKRVGLQMGSYDSYVNIAGGMKISEPAADAAVIAAIASSYRNKPVDPLVLLFGEVGLTGELRAVNMADKRVMEAAKLGFTHCVLPKSNVKGMQKPPNIRLLGVENVNELLEVSLT